MTNLAKIRVGRVSEQLKKELSDLIQKHLKDPRIGFVTVTAVEATGDLQHAKVFISILGDDEQKEQTLLALNKSKGFLRGEVSKRIRLRHTPELIFVFDQSIEYGSRINQLLHDLNDSSERNEDD